MNKLVYTFALVLVAVCLANASPRKRRADEEESSGSGLPDMSNNPMMGMMTTLMNSFGGGSRGEGSAGRDGFTDMFGGIPTGMPTMPAMPSGMPAMEMPTGFPDMSALTGGGGEGGSE